MGKNAEGKTLPWAKSDNLVTNVYSYEVKRSVIISSFTFFFQLFYLFYHAHVKEI